MTNQILIEDLNTALNREVSTLLRYLLQAAAIKGAEWEAARQSYLAEVLDELGHAQYLANKIVVLGGTPSLDPDLTPPPKSTNAMLENDIKEEHKDVEAYTKLAHLAEKEGLAELKIKMEEQAADEAGHAESMQRMLG